MQWKWHTANGRVPRLSFGGGCSGRLVKPELSKKNAKRPAHRSAGLSHNIEAVTLREVLRTVGCDGGAVDKAGVV
jgi:hypothetical protein